MRRERRGPKTGAIFKRARIAFISMPLGEYGGGEGEPKFKGEPGEDRRAVKGGGTYHRDDFVLDDGR